MPTTALPPLTLRDCSQAAQARIRDPKTRGAFHPIDGARRQLALLSVADGFGQSRIYWLIDLDTRVVADARFLGFGTIASHAITDAFTELVRQQPLEDALSLPIATVEARLRDDPATPAFGDLGLEPLAYLPDLQERARNDVPDLKVLPKPAEKERYVRKREADWDAHDQAWLPLGLMQKVKQAEDASRRAITERLGRPDIRSRVEGLHDDLKVIMTLEGLPAEEVPTVLQFIQSQLQADLHPAITVEAHA